MRNELINTILFILWHMSLDLKETFENKINSFSNEELKEINNFLIKWDINKIILFLENKNKDLNNLINIIKQQKWIRRIKTMKQEEKLDKNDEINNTEKLILNIQ